MKLAPVLVLRRLWLQLIAALSTLRAVDLNRIRTLSPVSRKTASAKRCVQCILNMPRLSVKNVKMRSVKDKMGSPNMDLPKYLRSVTAKLTMSGSEMS